MSEQYIDSIMRGATKKLSFRQFINVCTDLLVQESALFNPLRTN